VEALKESFVEMDEVMKSNVGRRILFKNILLKDDNHPYEFPKNIDLKETPILDMKSTIDLGIMIEDKVLEKCGKLPE